MTKPPDAFLSYTRFDDRHERGKISEFRNRLADTVRAVTGDLFEVFQDVDDIAVGERWSGKLDGTIDQVPFFIPILTPSYFRSEACRDELGKFLKAEKARGRNDLILPIYYIECHVLEDPASRAADPLAKDLHERQCYDWRKLRHNSFDTKTVKTAFERMARDILKARSRSMSGRPEAEVQRANEQSIHERLRAQAERNRALLRAALPRNIANILTPPGIAKILHHGVPQAEARKQSGASLEPDTIFRDIDAPWCPELVVIPRGEFLMGSTEPERQWAVDLGIKREWVEPEKPQHMVSIAYSLAVGRYPVTENEFSRFEADKFGLPVQLNEFSMSKVDVSWADAKGYVEWLAAETRRPYRLLTEAEWEYACRAGTSTRYWWGDKIQSEKMSRMESPWGLFAMHGSVWQWVEDRWHDSYNGAPNDGSAWLEGNDYRRVLRGGSRSDGPEFHRAAYRIGNLAATRSSLIGFRVARTVSL